jgi:hypothetical protein
VAATTLWIEHPMRMTMLCLLVSTVVAFPRTVSMTQNPSKATSLKPPVMVIGFVGGFIRHDNNAHGGVQLAAQLQKDYPSGVYIRVFENRYRKAAQKAIQEILDTNHDGKLSDEEKQKAQIIIYGHSWGGSETVELAIDLQSEGIPATHHPGG